MTILEHWGSRGVYDKQFVDKLKGIVATQHPESSAVSTFGRVSSTLCSISFQLQIFSIYTWELEFLVFLTD